MKDIIILSWSVFCHADGVLNFGKERGEFLRVKNMVVTKDMIIGEVLDVAPETAEFFFEIGMHCLGCPHSRGESIEDACLVHGADLDALLEKINGVIADK
jgi:hybrid cluster-associated redox disulfide protein